LRAIDYACGSGHFLTEYAQQLPALLQTHKNLSDPSSYFAHTYGIEKEDRLAKVAKVSAFMYGFKEIQVIDSDALVPHAQIKEQGFSVLVANPPFAVEDFLLTVPEADRERFALLRTVSDMGNRNVQCFFLERAQQLLAPGGVVGVIVPSSILSNTDSTHIATREMLLKYFDFVSITELGGQTFGKTGTNTVVLFLRRKSERPEPAEHYWNRTLDFFENWQEEAQSGGGVYQDIGVVRQYCQHVGVEFDAYASLLSGQPSDVLRESDIFKDYKRAFDGSSEVRRLKDSRVFVRLSIESQTAELTLRFTQYCRAVEQAKLYHYMLAHNNPCPVLIVKTPADNKLQKKFLGYEWSGAKGSEGIQYSHGDTVQNIQTPLFDPNDRDNAEKISYLIRQNFEGKPFVIPDNLKSQVSQAKLVDLLEFERVEFDKVISLNIKATALIIKSQWTTVKLAEICEMRAGKFVSASDINDVLTENLYPCYGGNGLRGYTKTFTHDGYYPLIGRQGALCGNVSIANGKFHATEHAVVVAPLDKTNIKWLFYKLNELNLNQFASGVAQPGLSIERLKELTVGFPPLNIQHQIVSECEAVDNAVEQAKADINKAKQAVVTVYENASRTSANEVKLSNSDLFDISIGRRVLKNEITDDASGTPVYSANVLQPFGYTQKQLLEDFSSSSVLWGIDGDWMVNMIPKNTPFYPTDHCGVIRVKAGANIHPHYLSMALEQEGQRVRFSRTNRAKTEAIKGLKLGIPSWEVQENLANIAMQANQTISTAESIIATAAEQKQTILNKYL
jgi:type I restriction-modification system DNA methylase subunit/restriction endonuclease S subunit